MKKSKFLKKSLAMLLALMLVVAMIPLSAAAASPVLSGIEVTAGGNVVQLAPPTQGTNAYEGAIPNTAVTVDVDVLVGPDYEVYYTRQNTTTTTDEKAKDTDGDGLMNITIPANELDQYRNENRQVVIEFTVAETAAPANRTEYTVVLTPQVAETGIQIEKFTINSNNGKVPQLGDTIIGAAEINITVPYDAAWIASNEFTVRDWVWAEGSEGATATVSNNSGYSATIEPGTNQDAQGTVVHDGDTITVTNNNNTRTYTLNITPAAGFVSFTTKEGLDAVLFTETGDIAVLLPYGYAHNYTGTVTVTPEFTLDYPSTEASWTSGEAITVNESIVNYNKFTDFLGENTNSWTERKNDADLDTIDEFVPGGVSGLSYREVTLTYAEETFRTYKVYFFEPAENSEADITELTIGSETATIDQETKTIDITLPMGTDVSKLNRYLSGTTYDSAVDIDLIASNNATISVEIPTASNATISEGDAATDAANDRNRYVAFDVSGEVNATNPVSIRVTSEDGLTTQDYTLNVTVADEYVDPAITDMSLQDPDTGISYDGELTTIQGQNVYVFEVPYSVYDRNKLNGWKFFWTKTVGATAVCNGEALAKSGAVIDEYDRYIPAPGTEQLGAEIEMKILGNEDYSARATSYYILINRADAKTTATIDEFALYGVPNFAAADNGALDDLHSTADIGSRFSYGSTIDQNKGTITVNVPYSVYAQWNAAIPYTAIVEAAEDSNAMVLVKANGEDTYTQVFSGKTDAYKNTPPTPTATNNTRWDLYDGAEILVLSEEAWVNLVDAGNVFTGKDSAENDGYYGSKVTIDAALSDTNTGNFKRYTLNIDQKDAELDNDVTSIRLVDGTGWTAPLTVVPDADGSSNLIADIPYALTSDIDDPETWNPVYLEYDVSDYAFVLGVNKGDIGALAPDVRHHTTGDLPTAGSNADGDAQDGVFIDIADYLEMYEKDGKQNYELALEHYFTDGNPFFLIDRDGTVYIYNNKNNKLTENTALEADYLAVSSEAMNAYTQYHLDLTVKTPNTESTFSSFYFKEYPAFRGVIDDATDTITVTLPYGSEYTYLTPVYTVSDGAIVTVDDPELQGKPLYNGYTDVNMTTTRKFTVIAENETNMHEYTVRVVLGNAFSDVNPDDWFYDNVMGAANNGYISGMGDGTFNPKGATTRAQFASMIAKAMGYDDSLAGETRFKDVPADQWYAGAITYCFDNDIISGYDDGTFQPDKTITRQEAASILKNAFNLTGNSGEKFPDDSAIAGWAKENVYAVKHSGLMKGDADTGNFRPTSTIIRAEAASILMNANRAGLIK